jgi:hypothetical protein
VPKGRVVPSSPRCTNGNAGRMEAPTAEGRRLTGC